MGFFDQGIHDLLVEKFSQANAKVSAAKSKGKSKGNEPKPQIFAPAAG